MKKYLTILFLSLSFINLNAQKHDEAVFSADHKSRLMKNIPDLNIGQKVPSVFLHKILNYKDSSATLSSFYQGKLLIIDFWATWCPPCIASLPALDSIQKKFPDKLRIITVTYESEKKVRSLFQKNKTVASSSLPFVVNDKWLNSLFRHMVVPHEVWIDSNGYVRAITNNYDITEENIDRILNNKAFALLTKKDSLSFDPSKPTDFSDSDILFRSVLAKFNPEIAGGHADIYNSFAHEGFSKYYTLYKRLFLTNRSIIQLFDFAFSNGTAGSVNKKRIVYNVPDSFNYIFPTRARFADDSVLRHKYGYFEDWLNEWSKKNIYSYELITKNYLADTLFFKYMMEDLNRYFDIKVKVEKKLIPCLVIKLPDIKDTVLFKSGSNSPRWFWSATADTLKRIRDFPLRYVVNYLNGFISNDPVVDETNYTGPVDLNLNISGCAHGIKFNEDQLIRNLSKYGLEVVREDHWIDVLMVSKK